MAHHQGVLVYKMKTRVALMRIAKPLKGNILLSNLVQQHFHQQKVNRPFSVDLFSFGSISSYIGDMKKVCLAIVTTKRGIWMTRPGNNNKFKMYATSFSEEYVTNLYPQITISTYDKKFEIFYTIGHT